MLTIPEVSAADVTMTMNKNPRLGFNPQTVKITDSFRKLDFFRDFLFLHPISAYPVNLWITHLHDLFESLSEKSKDFLFSYYDEGVKPEVSAPEIRLSRQRLVAEIRDSFQFKTLLGLIGDYEYNFFCKFDRTGKCPDCGRKKNEALESPLCSVSIMKSTLPNPTLPNPTNQRKTENPNSEDEERSTEAAESLEFADPAELNDSQVGKILKHFGVRKHPKKIGSITADGMIESTPVVVWRHQTLIDESEVYLLAESVEHRSICLVVDEQYLPKDVPQIPTVAIKSYSENVFGYQPIIENNVSVQ
jgi:hypothetical protein